MKSILQHFFIAAVLCLFAGCNEMKVAGFYYSEKGDALQIKKDGEVLWSPLSKTTGEFRHLGILSWNEEKMEAFLSMSSNDSLYGTKLIFSHDLKTITVRWSPYGAKKARDRSITFIKRK